TLVGTYRSRIGMTSGRGACPMVSVPRIVSAIDFHSGERSAMTQAVHRAVQLIEPCELLGVVKFRRRSTELLRDLDRKLDRGRNVDLVACAGCRARYHRFGRDRHADDRRVGCDRGLQYAVDVIDVVAVGGNVLHGDRERDGRSPVVVSMMRTRSSATRRM